MHNLRIRVLFLGIVAIFIVADARLFFLQIVQGEHYADYADRQRVALLPREAVRARILTRDGKVLAEDRLAFDVSVVIEQLDPAKERAIRGPLRGLFYVSRKEKLCRVDDVRWEVYRAGDRTCVRASSNLAVEAPDEDGKPRMFLPERKVEFPLPDGVVRSVRRLAELAGEPYEVVLDRVVGAAVDVARLRTPVFDPVPVVTGVEYEVVAAVETRADEFRGFVVTPRLERVRPLGALAAHTVGYVQRFDEADVAAAMTKYPGWPGRSFFITQRTGRNGIEKSMNDMLQGEFGMECVERDHLNRQTGPALADAPPLAGRDVVLTIDSRLQQITEEAMSDVTGAAVFIDVPTGQIIAVASSPKYDPADLSEPRRYAELLANTDAPLFNRAVQGRLPLGSVFKIVTALAALEKGCVPDSVNCTGSIQRGGVTFRCNRRYGHGPMNLVEAIKYSCNVFFYETAERVGDAALTDMARRLGFGSATGVQIPHESAGSVPAAARGGDLVNLGIGQGRLVVTPLQVAQMVAAVAGDGVLMPPKIVRELRPFDTESPAAQDLPDDRVPVRLKLPPGALEAVRRGLFQVVNEEGGTGHRAFAGFSRPFVVCGKTSTAERGPRGAPDNVGWFAGYAPADRPRIAFVVAVEHLSGSEGGGSTAAPVARNILERIPLDLLGLEERREGSE